MSALRDRLLRLQRQAGAVAPTRPAPPLPAAAIEPASECGGVVSPAAQAGDTTPAAVAGVAAPAVAATVMAAAPCAELDRLRRLRRLLNLRPAASLPRPVLREALPLRGEEVAPGVYYVESRVDAAGSAALWPPRWAEVGPVARERFLCFDTETTGLAGGSGTRAFMIGAADWYGGALRIRQLYLTAMAGETAMLRRFASWLNPDTVLVSYNGRSYDAPLLATRYRLQRLANPLSGIAHVDLLHPVRRVYRGRWENCRLATIERQVLRIVREDDLPGSQAPAAWRAWLRQGASTDFMRVLEHNRQDVAALALLLEHMDRIATDPPAAQA